MSTFAENLRQLPSITHLAQLQLLDEQGNIHATIDHLPGKSGSLAVYHALSQRHGGQISPAAAEEGVLLFAEHSADARARPGAHPNIDRLFDIIATGKGYTVRLVDTSSAASEGEVL